MTKQRFLFYTANNYRENVLTGGNKRFMMLIEELLGKGDEVILLAPEGIAIEQHKNLHVIPVKAYSSKIFPNGLLNCLFNWRQFHKAKSYHPDRTVLYSLPYGIQGVLIGFRNMVLLIRENYFEYQRFQSKLNGFLLRKFFTLFYLPLERYTLKRVDKIIVQCNYDKNKMLERHQKWGERIQNKTHVLPNNVNPPWIKEQIKHYPPNREKAEKAINLVFIGNLDNYRKGLHILLSAAEKLLQHNYQINLNVVGGGKLLERYRAKYRHLTSINFYGHQRDSMDFFINQDLLVVPSLADSFPNTILEGLYFGIPVIGANRGGIPEILNYEELLFEPETHSLFYKLAKIIDGNLFERYRLMCLGRKEALHFDWGEAMRELLL
jgi:glycosyltransferase involved in cell wall biosynthesis